MKIKLKKSLGQNFLKSKNILDIIIKTSNLKENDIILEIGPGKGFLTEKLLKKAEKVIVVEKDNRLIEFLNEKFKKDIKNKKLKIIEEDILDFDINYLNKINSNIFLEKINKFDNHDVLKYKIVANIPYYITGQIIKKFLSAEKQPTEMILMIQKEVAKRIIDKKESLLSLSVKVYGEPKYIKTVKSKNFYPQPKVDSSILLIKDISKEFFKSFGSSTSKWEKKFFSLIRAGFSHKRKTLLNNLKTNWSFVENLDKKEIENILKKTNISLKSRSEDLSKEDWKNILKNFK